MHNFPKTLPAHLAEQADIALKDSYTLDFLDVEEPIRERELERRLLIHLNGYHGMAIGMVLDEIVARLTGTFPPMGDIL